MIIFFPQRPDNRPPHWIQNVILILLGIWLGFMIVVILVGCERTCKYPAMERTEGWPPRNRVIESEMEKQEAECERDCSKYGEVIASPKDHSKEGR